MRFQKIAVMLFVSSAIATSGQTASSNNAIQIKFVVDGHAVACKALSVELALGNRHFKPPITDGKFVVPREIFKVNASKRRSSRLKLDAIISCDSYTVDITGLHPSWGRPGWWTAGISYPTAWFDEPSTGIIPETGSWISYLEADCSDCDPAVIVEQTHSDVPQAVLESLRKEQPSAGEVRARDIAYALAVFHSEYESNRDRLTKQLSDCLDSGKEPATKDESDFDTCDGRLFAEIVNLYWRGDDTLLLLLLQPSYRDLNVVDDSGRFYADLLDRRTEIALQGISQLPPHKQRAVCERSVKDEFRWFDPPKLARVEAKLRAIDSETASDCLKTIEATADQSR